MFMLEVLLPSFFIQLYIEDHKLGVLIYFLAKNHLSLKFQGIIFKGSFFQVLAFSTPSSNLAFSARNYSKAILFNKVGKVLILFALLMSVVLNQTSTSSHEGILCM